MDVFILRFQDQVPPYRIDDGVTCDRMSRILTSRVRKTILGKKARVESVRHRDCRAVISSM
jgi:hypothetical protein